MAENQPARRLKICFISEPLHAGVGRHVVDAVCEFSGRGHDIHLLYSPLRLDPDFLATIQRESQAKCVAIPMPRAIGGGDAAAFRQIRDYVRAAGPFDIIHGHSSKGGGYARLLRLFGSTPVIYTPHAFFTLSPLHRGVKKFAYRTLETSLSRLTARIICGSIAEVEHAHELGISPSRLATIANGIERPHAPARDVVRAKLGLTEQQIAVGFVGRMDDQKAPERLVAAACRLLPELPNLTFLMIGDGPKRAPLEADFQKAGLSHRVQWLGAVDAKQFMPAMDVFALTSHYEGFAHVLLEALYTGLPIVSTPVGGAPETIAPDVNGILVPHDQPDRLTEALRRLIVDHDLRRAMGKASHDRASEFTIPIMVDNIENLYRSVLAAR